MSNVQSVKTTVVPVIEPEALEYARKEGIEDVVRRLADATARVFPTAASVRVRVEPDPEIRDLWVVVFEATVPRIDVPDFRAADDRWRAEYERAYPYPRNHFLSFNLKRV